MKKLLLLALATCFTFGIASAQPDPGYFMWVGNPDCSDFSVGTDADIEVPVWYQSPAGDARNVGFVHVAVASNDLYISSRSDGAFFYPFTENWDLVGFLPEDNPGNNPDIPPGWRSQSFAALANVSPPFDALLLNTNGEQWLIFSFFMHTDPDPGHVNQTYCDAFAVGDNTANPIPIDFSVDPVGRVLPEVCFSCLFFSPNQDPVLECGGDLVGIVNFLQTQFVLATDVDGDLLTISQTGGPGSFVQTQNDPGVGSGTWSWTPGLGDVGTHLVSFMVEDGAGGVAECSFNVTVEIGNLDNAVLDIGGRGSDCVPGFPGTTVTVPLFLYNEGLVGGFVILFNFDPTALTLTGIAPTARIYGGSEYFFANIGAEGPGTARVTWIADINNGVDGPPMLPGDGAILELTFDIDAALPWGMYLPIDFFNVNFTDNKLSDETGYILADPVLLSGCILTANPQEFKGDPNVNCYPYEVADAVLVARRLIEGYVVWSENTVNCYGFDAGTADDGMQEAAGDLNDNGTVDVADLVRFIMIINGLVSPPKLDPAVAYATVSMPVEISENMVLTINSGVDVGGVLLSINHQGVEVGAPLASNGMELRYYDHNGVINVVVYSIDGYSIPAGTSNLITIPVVSNDNGSMEIAEVSAADAYGRLLQASAHLVAPVPTAFSVAPNYPNPFNAKTLISFALPTDSDVSVAIYSITGQLVETINGHFQAGEHSIIWDASDASTGVYFYKVTAGEHSQTMKMTLLK